MIFGHLSTPPSSPDWDSHQHHLQTCRMVLSSTSYVLINEPSSQFLWFPPCSILEQTYHLEWFLGLSMIPTFSNNLTDWYQPPTSSSDCWQSHWLLHPEPPHLNQCMNHSTVMATRSYTYSTYLLVPYASSHTTHFHRSLSIYPEVYSLLEWSDHNDPPFLFPIYHDDDYDDGVYGPAFYL